MTDMMYPPIYELIHELGGQLTRENVLEYFYWTPFYEADSINEMIRAQRGSMSDFV